MQAHAETLEALSAKVRYRHDRLLGQGGMGEVRASTDLRLGRVVATKVIRSAADSGDHLQRFLREAQVQGQLEHPSIVPVYDLGLDEDGNPFFTMKRVSGVTLAEILDGLMMGDQALLKRYSRHRLLTAFQTVCQAVDFAHCRGVIHRDLKPANIMLGDFGEVYVLDFGLAKLSGDTARDAPVDKPSRRADSGSALTLAGVVMGTPGYLAPEQARGEPVDARSDIYSLGLHPVRAAHAAAVPRGQLGRGAASLRGEP